MSTNKLIKFRRKPTEVEAVQFLGNKDAPNNFFDAFNIKFPIYRDWHEDIYIMVPTKYGAVKVMNRDWLVLEKEHLVIVKEHIFNETFERV
jgi:hypothetical protein